MKLLGRKKNVWRWRMVVTRELLHWESHLPADDVGRSIFLCRRSGKTSKCRPFCCFPLRPSPDWQAAIVVSPAACEKSFCSQGKMALIGAIQRKEKLICVFWRHHNETCQIVALTHRGGWCACQMINAICRRLESLAALCPTLIRQSSANHFSAALDADVRLIVVCRYAFAGFWEGFNYFGSEPDFSGGKSGELGRINVDTRRLWNGFRRLIVIKRVINGFASISRSVSACWICWRCNL